MRNGTQQLEDKRRLHVLQQATNELSEIASELRRIHHILSRMSLQAEKIRELVEYEAGKDR